jgi:hypothetical protein
MGHFRMLASGLRMGFGLGGFFEAFRMITLSMMLGGHFMALGGGVVVLGRLGMRFLWHFALLWSGCDHDYNL